MGAALISPAAPFAALALVLPLLAIVSPAATVPALLAAALWAGALHWRRRDGWPALPRTPLVLLVLLLAWAAVASAWTFDPGRAIVLVLRLAAVYGAGLYLWTRTQGLDGDARAAVASALAGGLTIAVLFLLEERLLGTPLFNLRSGPPADAYEQFSRFNRGATALALLVWPVAADLWRRQLGPWALAVPLLLLGLLLSFESNAAILGLAGGLAVVGLGLLERRLARALALLALAVALFATPLIAGLMAGADWHEAEWLPRTAAQRVFIWGFTAERILEQPLFGWGFDAARNMPNFETAPLFHQDSIIPLHPHNGALQILLELGYLGAAIAGLLLGWLILALRRAGKVDELCGLGLFVAALAVALTAYGLWQTKWQALLVLAFVLFAAVRADQPQGR
ncbi:MAG: O-antigen ligase family protein [Pseudomonadota bacterium]